MITELSQCEQAVLQQALVNEEAWKEVAKSQTEPPFTLSLPSGLATQTLQSASDAWLSALHAAMADRFCSILG